MSRKTIVTYAVYLNRYRTARPYCMTLRLIARQTPFNSFVRVADQPADTPNLLFVQGIELDPAAIRFRWGMAFDTTRRVWGIK